jgi:hypothetical protein
MRHRAGFSIWSRKRTKFLPGTRIVGRHEAPSEYRSRQGTVIEYIGASLYRIKFDDQEERECVLSVWIELQDTLQG